MSNHEQEILWKRLRANEYDDSVDVVGFFEAPAYSVLAGQTLKKFLGNYSNEEAALLEHPDAEGWSHPLTDPQVSVSHLPGENDPVPGGMYPDDFDDNFDIRVYDDNDDSY